MLTPIDLHVKPGTPLKDTKQTNEGKSARAQSEVEKLWAGWIPSFITSVEQLMYHVRTAHTRKKLNSSRKRPNGSLRFGMGAIVILF